MLPSTAPCYPAPGKRFLIIRTELQPPQHSMKLGFDSFSSSFTSFDTILDYRGTPASHENTATSPSDSNMPSFKKRWSLLGRVLPFGNSQDSPTSDSKRTWEEELEQARRETAASRLVTRGALGPPPPPKQGPSTAVTPSSDSISSAGSSPMYEGATFIFRFTLTWQTGPNGGPVSYGPTRDRILTRPRLPGPAQARVSARSAGSSQNGGAAGPLRNLPPIFRSDSPPPIAPGLPPETRRVSGLLQTGLISEARNARPLSVAVDEPWKQTVLGSGQAAGERRLSLSINVTPLRLTTEDGVPWGEEEERSEVQSPVGVAPGMGFPGLDADRDSRLFDLGNETGQTPPPPQGQVVRAERPAGVYASGAVYAGRALAEWSVVVGECNAFVDRRRDEGVLGLSDVEVPTLGVEGLGLRQRG